MKIIECVGSSGEETEYVILSDSLNTAYSEPVSSLCELVQKFNFNAHILKSWISDESVKYYCLFEFQTSKELRNQCPECLI